MNANLNKIERETIGLCVCMDALDNLVNHTLLLYRPVSEFPGEAEVIFHTRVHQELFLIRLLDFLKESGSSQLTGMKGSCLDVLKATCVTRSFDSNGCMADLERSVNALSNWITSSISVTLWLPTLDINAELHLSRLDMLAIAGNQSKHNLSRLTGVSKRVEQLLSSHGYDVALEDIPLSLDDFREHLQGNFFIYCGTWLAELLNNVRWGLQRYLEPTYGSAIKVDSTELGRYHYRFPAGITNPGVKDWFWQLMNIVRRNPYFPQFAGAHYLKHQSSLERDH